MKAVLLICLCLELVLLSTFAAELDQKSINLQRCQRRVRANCDSNAKKCVRIARSNLCELYDNSCQQRLENCRAGSNTMSKKIYQRVNIKLCSGMSINQRLPCSNRQSSSSSSSSNNNSSTPIIYA